jgi:arsenite methyltransferase
MCNDPSADMRYSIRAATTADLSAVRELLASAALPVEGVEAQFGSSYAVAVSQSGAIIGAEGIETYGSSGLLRSAVVDAAWRGRGVGEALTNDRLAWARTVGLREIYLLTTTAAEYFRNFGFVPVERASAPPELQASSEFASVCPSSATTMRLVLSEEPDWHRVAELVQAKYGAAALRAAAGARATCCGSDDAQRCNPITANLYEPGQAAGLPAEALLASLGCGNPTALAQLEPGQTVLDLGSGGGIDVLLSARRVGSAGKAYGLDMTDEMLALARENQRKAGATNVEFLKGEIENIPLPNGSVDVIISNCVINLSADKPRVIAEAFRVLKPGGRLAISDVVVRGSVPAEMRRSVELWIGCVSGALEESEYRRLLLAAGFTDVEVEPTRVYRFEDAGLLLAQAGIDAESVAHKVEGKFMSAFIRATKPAQGCSSST